MGRKKKVQEKVEKEVEKVEKKVVEPKDPEIVISTPSAGTYEKDGEVHIEGSLTEAKEE